VNAKATAAGADDAPLNTFSNCHSGILRHLADLGDLPMLLAPAQRARRIAQEALDFFRAAVFEHHAEEEAELFSAVLKSAEPGAERERVQAMTKRLIREHRAVEALWKSLEPGLKQVAKGHDSKLDTADLERLVRQYTGHAAFEEAEFLPLAQQILSRNANHMEALGLSLHMRHMPPPMKAYI
jgi:hemerythrin-like domain-containing protein